MLKFIIIILAFVGFVSLYIDFGLSINNCQKFLNIVLSEKNKKLL